MNNNGNFEESIKLSLPVNGAYVSAARLTASSIANRMVFDIDEIEDVKAAVSEACTFIIKKLPTDLNRDFEIIFVIGKGVLTITIGINTPLDANTDEEEMSLVMIKALMDEVEIHDSNIENFKIKMIKTHKEITFD